MRAAPNYERAYDAEPLVTAWIATYNRAELLCERSLASLRAQTYERWEAVVVGDHCTDDTAERVAALGDSRIRFENLPRRGPYPEDDEQRWMVAGTAPARRAFELARGQWLAQLDDDDEWDPDHLEVLLAEARRTRAEVVYGKWRLGDAANRRLLRLEIGQWPPRYGYFGFQTAIDHAGLRRFRHNPRAYLVREPGDWHRARRLWEAGVRFAYVDRPVTTIWYTPRHPAAAAWFDEMRRTAGYV